MNPESLHVAVVGASAKPERYSHQAILFLRQAGHAVYPIHPALTTIEGLPVFPRLSATPAGIDVVTLYLRPDRQAAMAPDILRVRPRVVIFNPGTENDLLAAELEAHGIGVVIGCTLVMLKTGQFSFEAWSTSTQ